MSLSGCSHYSALCEVKNSESSNSTLKCEVLDNSRAIFYVRIGDKHKIKTNNNDKLIINILEVDGSCNPKLYLITEGCVVSIAKIEKDMTYDKLVK